MAERAIELLALPQDGVQKMILDLGCGSGLSGAAIERMGHLWVGMDISSDMICTILILWNIHLVAVASERLEKREETDKDSETEDMEMDEESEEDNSESDMEDDEEDEDMSLEGESEEDEDEESEDSSKCVDLFVADMGEGVGFRPGTFDGCISISALQWLCHSNRNSEKPKARLSRLFTTLFGCLSRGARAVFQFFPETASQIELILACAMRAGFTGGLVVDYPNSSKAKKYYLCLMTGQSSEIPRGLDGTESSTKNQVAFDKRAKQRYSGPKSAAKNKPNRKEWVQKKKELARKRGQSVKGDSKYTARRRKGRF